MNHDEVEFGLMSFALPARGLATITDLDAFRRERALNNWLAILCATCLGLFSGVFAMKISPLVANPNWFGF